MSDASNPEVRYHPVHCALLDKQVWAIRMRQPDGTWRIVNCLDKDEGCFRVECVFTTSCGVWPYPSLPTQNSLSAPA